MKRLIIFTLGILAAACGSNSPAGKFTVKGSFDVPNDSVVVYVWNPETGDTIAKAPVTDGTFTIKGNVEEPVCARFNFAGNDFPFFLEKGVITMDLKNFSAGGSPLNEASNELAAKLNELNKPLYDISKEYDALPQDASQEQKNALEVKYSELEPSINESSIKARYEAYIANKDNIFGASCLAFLPTETFLSEYENAETIIKENFYVKNRKIRIEELERTTAGHMFTDFTIEHGNIDGSAAKLSDYVGKGKYILVDFWASWCGPCRSEIPNIKSVYDRYKGEKFDVLSVAVMDKHDATLKAIEEEQITWNCIIDDVDGVSLSTYQIQGIPQIILFAPDGTIIERDLRGTTIGARLAEILK